MKEEDPIEKSKEQADKRWADYQNDILNGSVLSGSGDKPVHIVSGFPVIPMEKNTDWTDQESLIREHLRPMGIGRYWNWEVWGEDLTIFHTKDDGTRSGLSEVLLESGGTLLAATVVPTAVYRESEEDALHAVGITGIEKRTIGFVHRSLNMSLKLGLSGPWLVGFGLLRLPKCKLILSRKEEDGREHVFPGGHIVPDLIVSDPKEESTDFQVVARDLLPSFNEVWRHFKVKRCLDYSPDGKWIGD